MLGSDIGQIVIFVCMYKYVTISQGPKVSPWSRPSWYNYNANKKCGKK